MLLLYLFVPGVLITAGVDQFFDHIPSAKVVF